MSLSPPPDMTLHLQVFRNYLQTKSPLSEKDWLLIAEVCTLKSLRKHQYLLQEGEIWRYHAFIAEGCLRRYTVDNDGIEHIVQFTPENWWAGDRKSLMEGTPSAYFIDAIEPSAVILIKDPDLKRLCTRIPVFDDLINTILQRSLNASQDRILAAISLNAEEKYLDFLSRFPQLNHRIPRHMLASFLGITPESLSRIKSKLARR